MVDFLEKLGVYYQQNKKPIQYTAIVLLLVLNFGLIISLLFSAIPNNSQFSGKKKDEIKVKGVIEVLNGSGKRGYNEKIADFLRQKGMDVVHMNNYHLSNIAETIIIQRNDNSLPAYYIAGLLSIDSTRVVNIQNKDYLLDATVILGRDIK